MITAADDRLLTIKEVEAKVKLTKPSIYRLIRNGKFPKPLKVGERASRWSYNQVMEWIESKKS